MKAYKIDRTKRVVVGILLVILTLGFCVVGTGAARPDMAGPGGQGFGGPMDQQGFGGQGGPMGGQGFGGQNGLMGQQGFDGQTPPDGDFDGQTPPDGASFPDGQFSRDDRGGFDHQRDFGGRGGFGPDGGFQPKDGGVREAIEALEDGDEKTALQTLLANVDTAMDALIGADDETREAAETALNDARDALDAALTAAGIKVPEAPEMPAEGELLERPANDGERPQRGGDQRPQNDAPDFLNRENLQNIDLDDEEQVQNLFQRFVDWLKGNG